VGFSGAGEEALKDLTRATRTLFNLNRSFVFIFYFVLKNDVTGLNLKKTLKIFLYSINHYKKN